MLESEMSKHQKNKQKAKPAAHKPHHKQAAPPAKAKPSLWVYVGLGALVLIVIGGPLLYMQFSKSPSGAEPTKLPLEISVLDAYEKYVDKTAFFLDVRTQEEWNEFHAPDATLIPLDELPSRLDELPRDRQIVVVCRSGNRSQQGRDILLNAGFTQVTSMAGGVKDWRAAKLPPVRGP
jgi:rhodanese-related sulfurtransferase